MRNPSIEVMRCVLMFLIVVYHGCNNGPFTGADRGTACKMIPWLLFFCTNSFMFISGWFGIRLSWKRLAKFLLMGGFASIVLFVLSKPVFGNWQYHFSLGWFGNCYLAIVCVAPLINAGVETLAKESRHALWGMWAAWGGMIMISCLMPKGGVVSLAVSGWLGHGFNTMLFVYVTARIMRLTGVERLMTVPRTACLFVFALGVHLSRLMVMNQFPGLKDWLIATGDYDSPEVLMMGVAFFFMFLPLRFKSWINQVCLFCAPSMFMVYLLHSGCANVGRMAYNRLILGVDGWMSPIVRFGGLTSIVIAAGVVFSVSVGVDLIRRLLMR